MTFIGISFHQYFCDLQDRIKNLFKKFYKKSIFIFAGNEKIVYLCTPILKKINFNKMANHKSSKKRIRQDLRIRLRNRYYKKTARTSIAKLRTMTDKQEALTFLPKVISMVDRLAKKNTWHKNKASNLKSKLTKYVNSL